MSQVLRKILADNISKYRKISGLKREQLSLMINKDNSYISKLKKYKVNITIDTIELIVKSLNIDVLSLFK